MKQSASLLLVVGLILLFGVGCVSNKKFETAISDVTSRVDDAQGALEANSEKIDALGKVDEAIRGEVAGVAATANAAKETGAAAFAKAESAEQAARGKVIWQVTLSNNDVRFGVDKTELADSGRVVLDDLVTKLMSLGKLVYLEIQGHTDSVGSETYNKVLGRKRAEAARDYLHSKGIPLNLLSVVSYGESKPIADNSDASGRATNRRVEILVLE